MPGSDNPSLKVVLTWKDKLILLAIMMCVILLKEFLGGPRMGMGIVVVCVIVKEMYAAAKEVMLEIKSKEDARDQ